MTRPLLAFDVNETLLDLSALDGEFERLFGDARVRREWFSQVLTSAMTVALTVGYRPFAEVAAGALSMVAERHGVTLDDADRRAVAQGMRRLPAHPEVAEALAQLRGAGFRLAALTNSGTDTMREQLGHAGLLDAFDDLFSVDSANTLKPALAVYRTAASTFGVPVQNMLLIACHGWDLAGAMTAGCRTAFVARPRQVLEPAFPAPDFHAENLTDLARELIAAYA
jgi:2-haloacid dehalogenase